MQDVAAIFPELDRIDDPDVRAGVRECWEVARDDADVESLASVPWLPPTQRELDLPDETLVGHVHDVVAGAVALGESLEQTRGATVDYDLLVGGALVHDVSKLYEFDGMTDTEVYDLLGHPYYGVVTVTNAGLPVEYAHIVLSHTSRTTVEPAFLEAELIKRADEAAARDIRLRAERDD